MNNFNEFYQKYKPIRNAISLCSPLENTLYSYSDEELEFVESCPVNKIWTVTNSGEIQNGISYNNVLGYIITTIPFKEKKYGIIKYKI